MSCFIPPTEFRSVEQYSRVQTEGTITLWYASLFTSAVLHLTNALSCRKVPTVFVIITSFSFSAENLKTSIQRCVRALIFNMMETNGLKVCPLLHLTPYHLGSCNTLKPKYFSLSGTALFCHLLKLAAPILFEMYKIRTKHKWAETIISILLVGPPSVTEEWLQTHNKAEKSPLSLLPSATTVNQCIYLRNTLCGTGVLVCLGDAWS